MKRILLTVFVFAVSLLMCSMAIAADEITPDCDNVDDPEAYELCNSYCANLECAAEDTDANPKACARLKANYAKVTGDDVLPCDIVACGVCASLNPDTGMGTVGICEEMKSIDCDDQGLENYGEYTCDAVTLPLPGGAPGCSEIQPGPFGTFIPDCQYVGGLDWVCTMFLGGVPVDEACPAPPECTDEQLEYVNMPR